MNSTPHSAGSGFQQGQANVTQGTFSHPIRTPGSASTNNTYLMPTSPSKRARMSKDSYKPKISRTCGQRPACLVNASVTFCGNNQIYAFGGFDQYTDEGFYLHQLIIRQLFCMDIYTDGYLVYNHVLRLDLNTLQWTLVDNYGDIPGVRMGD